MKKILRKRPGEHKLGFGGGGGLAPWLPSPQSSPSFYLLCLPSPGHASPAINSRQKHWPRCKWACAHSHSCDTHFMLITLLIYAWG